MRTNNASVLDGLVDVILEGGPASCPRRTRVEPHAGKVKIPNQGGYEHFERVESGHPEWIFRWTMRTKIAE
ncbi:DUF5988 family protein [Herbidospora sp. RD11066]